MRLVDGTAHEDLDLRAAEITAAVLRFDVERLPRNPMALPPDQPGKLGEVAFIFFPDQRLVAADALATHLAGLRKPVLLAALATKGYVGAWWRDGLSPRALEAWHHNVANAERVLASQLQRRNLDDADAILIETTLDRFYAPVAALRRWIASYRVDILWNIVALDGDSRARVRLLLGRGDGSTSPGAACGPPG